MKPLWISLLIVSGLLAGCGGTEDPALGGVTAVRVTTKFDPAWSLTQLTLQAGEHRSTVPEKPAPLDSGETVVIELGDDAAGKSLHLDVWGLSQGNRVAFGDVSAKPKLHETVEAKVELVHLPCGAWCTEGANGCVGDGTHACTVGADGCGTWSEAMPCPMDAPFCSLGQCGATCIDECAEGNARCAGPTGLERCGQADSDTCLDWLPVEPCGEGLHCELGVCTSAECADECEAGSTQCSGAGTVSCGQYDGDDCLDRGPEVPCSNGQSCSNGTCVDGCTDDCSANECSGLVWRQCGQFDFDACLDRSAGTSCQPENTCEEGACDAATGCSKAPLVCEDAPENTCVGDGTLRVYAAQGTCGAGKCEYAPQDVACPNCPNCDVCAAITCNNPPQPTACYAASGTCTDGSCHYDYADGSGCDDGNACTDGDTCASGVCSGTAKTCNVADPPTCVDATTLRTFATPGSCSAGNCTYPHTDVTCAGGCSNGTCKAPTCTEGIVTIDGPANVQGLPSIATDGSGGVHISYYEYVTNSTGKLKYAFRAPGAAWTSETVDANGNVGQQSALAVDTSGGVHIAYMDYGFFHLKYAYKPAGGNWQVAVIDESAAGDTPSIAIDTFGRIHVSYSASGGVNYIFRNGQGNWSFVDAIEAELAFSGTSALAVDASGMVHVVYSVVSSKALMHAYGSWNDWVVTEVGPDAIDASVALDGLGAVHVLYGGVDNQVLKYAKRTSGGSWTTSVADAGLNVGSYPSAHAQTSGALHVSYIDGTNLDLKYAKKPVGGMWTIETLDAAATVAVGTSLALDASNGVHIAYVDDAMHDLKYAEVCR